MVAARHLVRFALAGALWLTGAPAMAEERVRIVVLLSSDAEPYQQALAGFRQQFTAPADYDVHTLNDDAGRHTQVLAKMKSARPSLYFTAGSTATKLAIQHGDAPVVAGLILNAGELGRSPRATGVVLEFPPEVQIDWLKRLLPSQRDIGILYNSPQHRTAIDQMVRLGEAAGLRVHARRVESSKDLPGALDQIESRISVLLGIPDPAVLNPQTAKPILLFSFRNRIPLVGLSEQWVKAGALYALNRDFHDIGRQCAEMAARMIEGTPASEIPVQTPRKVAYIVNAKTARQMRIEIPERLMQGAQRIVE